MTIMNVYVTKMNGLRRYKNKPIEEVSLRHAERVINNILEKTESANKKNDQSEIVSTIIEHRYEENDDFKKEEEIPINLRVKFAFPAPVKLAPIFKSGNSERLTLLQN